MPHIAVIVAGFYQDIASELIAGAEAALTEAEATFDRLDVPGAFEIPAAVAMAINNGRYDGYVALGCVIRGETTHYDYVAGESARGLVDLSIKHRVPLGNGVLTVENREQAMARAAVDKGNKGAAAANACLEMLELSRRLRG